jgi:tRNA(fMet)-specific endonuclease VapC
MGNVAERLLSTPPSEIGISTVVLYEIEVGIAKSSSPKKRRSQLDTFVSYATILPFREKEARVAAILRANLEKQGRPIGPLDNLIAGTALSQGAILVTNNVEEFSRVEGLKIENWF